MGPPIATATLSLKGARNNPYPLYAADFDPWTNGLLLVGGGGGESKSGVGNKISLVDTSRKHTISEIIPIDLSSDEDSVTSLAIAQSEESSGVAFAGINSSSADQAAGKNEHLRSFELRYPPRKKVALDAAETLREQALESTSATRALGKISLFKPSATIKKETYQRVLRLSRPKPGHKARLGAVATGLAPEGEIVVFDASKPSPTVDDVLCKIVLGKGQEAGDVDVIHHKDSTYHLVYCTDYEVYATRVPRSQPQNAAPLLALNTPPPDASASDKTRPKFRSLRYLSPNLLLVLQNRPNRTGADLLLVELTAPSFGNVILRKPLHRSINTATGLSVSLLPSSDASDHVQNVIAVAGQDNSISIFTIDHPWTAPFPKLKFRSHALLHNVHPLQITSLTLSIFQLPTEFSKAPPQYMKLASTSIASTVVVQTFPLRPYPEASNKQRPRRYVLTIPGRSEVSQTTFSVLISVLVIALGAFLLQAFTEIRGVTPEYLGAKGWLNERVHGWIAKPYMFEDVMEKLSVPGVEPRPTEGIKSQAVELIGVTKDNVLRPKQQREQAIERGRQAAQQAQETATEVAEEATKGAKSDSMKLGLRDLRSLHSSLGSQSAPGEKSKAIVVAHDEESKALFADACDPDTVISDTHTKWEELEAYEKETWKRRLIDAGEWALEEGESVLKGVLFQNIALAVGAAVREEL